jgi:hypothetical protein
VSSAVVILSSPRCSENDSEAGRHREVSVNAKFSNPAAASGARPFLPIRRIFGCRGIPLIFACSGGFNSLIGRKNFVDPLSNEFPVQAIEMRAYFWRAGGRFGGETRDFRCIWVHVTVKWTREKCPLTHFGALPPSAALAI